jgi:outer membrane protein assembly factor BamB
MTMMYIKDSKMVGFIGNKALRYFILLLMLVSNLFLSAQNWNVSTGGNPQRNGLSDQFGPIDETLLWSGGLTSVIAQAPVSDSIYLAAVRIHNLGDHAQGSKIVMMDIRNGDTLWTKNLPMDFPATDWYNKISAIKDGVLYASRAGNSNQSYIYALDASNGSIIWRSESLTDESSSEGLNFLSNGDLIVGNTQSVLRINKSDGSTVWETSRLAYQNGAELAIYNSKIYGIVNDLGFVKIAAFDSSTGQLLYKTSALDGGLVQQHGLFIGVEGTIYLPRSQNNPITDSLYSFTDNGSAFDRNWSLPIHYVPFSSAGVGNDGTVYSYSRSGKVIRIDPVLGTVMDSSLVVLGGGGNYPRLTIDATGKVYVTNGGFSNGNFYSFNADLTLRWQSSITNVFIGGPIIGWEGTLVICGTGTDIRAYKGDVSAAIDESLSNAESEFSMLFPNPFRDQLNLKADPSLVGSSFVVFDCAGKSVFSGMISSEITTLDLSHLSSGIYLFGIGNNKDRLLKLIKE